MRQIECLSQRGAGSMVDKYFEHAHQKFRVVSLAHGPGPHRIIMGARDGMHAPHLAPPNIGDFVTPDIGHRTERDTLKSTYVKQLPLFGKATEVAKIFGFGLAGGAHRRDKTKS